MKLRQKKFYDKRYSSLERAFHKPNTAPMVFYDTRLIEKLLGALRARTINSILEVGCGRGTDAVLVSKYAHHLVAIDVSSHALKVATTLSRMKIGSEKISFLVCDAEHLPLRESVFDIVFCKDLLHHVPHSLSTVLEMKRVARKTGKVVAIEANACNPQMLMVGLMNFSVDKGVFKNTKAKLIRTFVKAGLSNISTEETEFLPRHFLFEYRSPLGRIFDSRSELVLKILQRIENILHDLPILKTFANYIISKGAKTFND